MLFKEERWQLSGTDLVGHLNCRHLTELEIAAATGTLKKSFRRDPHLELLRERGAIHEKAFLDHLTTQSLEVVEISGVGVTEEMASRTLEAMRRGAAVISQGAFLHGGWGGRTDILRRVEVASDLGPWSYEVIDTKLANETKGGTILQLCLYSELLGFAQGREPEFMYVVTPWTDYQPQAFRVAEYSAYYRHMKAVLGSRFPNTEALSTYPDPKGHCEVCHWGQHCDSVRRADDHLCLVAGISKAQINELSGRGVTTMEDLASMPLPLSWKPTRGSVHSYIKASEQARLQVEGRTTGLPTYETLPIGEGGGLSSLPAPSPGDLFFDLEGDPFVGEGGLEFLFGYSALDQEGLDEYTANWVITRAEEKAAFERFIDAVMERWSRYPGMHIYHFAPYEPSALKRLMGRYATREAEMDRLLRAELFVDLYAVVRQSVRASVESYSIKKLEVFYDFTRSIPLSEVGSAMVQVQAALELNRTGDLPQEAKQTVIEYNRDDCVSTRCLRDWLETIRAKLVAEGHTISRPEIKPGSQSDEANERTAKIAALVGRLTADVPVDPEARSAEQQGRWLLANVLDWHRREEKATWWEYFRLCGLPEEDLMEERTALAGLSFVGEAGGSARAPIHRYQFPPQETELRGGEKIYQCGGEEYGSIHSISFENGTVEIKKRRDTAGLHASALFTHSTVSSKELADSLLRIGEYVADHGLVGEGRYQAARELLLKSPPRTGTGMIQMEGDSPLASACRVALLLDGGVLPIQGPPGAGKTFTGARMICELVRAGKRVGITANSHKVVRNILDAVVQASIDTGVTLQCIQKVSEMEEKLDQLSFSTKNAAILSALQGSCQVAGGTAWLWSREDTFEAVDVLFVDEAAQMSLANVLAVSQAARSVVLLGDPQQLDQPMKGSHPEGTDVSALNHILDGQRTISGEKGLFLEETWRLHPNICQFTSEAFYEGRLRSRSGREAQAIRSTRTINGSGLRFVPVPHEGNQNSSPEEAEAIHRIVDGLLSGGATWFDHDGTERILSLQDILIVAPYNAQVFELQTRLPGARIGTVDKFQGQEAPVAIYSLTTSTYADAPRGMEFLYSLNRLNVATSRARCLSILVGSPQLFEPDCRTSRQMQLANAFCRYLELAEVIRVPPPSER